MANQLANTPPISSVFAGFLGYNPIESLLTPTGALNHLSTVDASALTGKEFFPQLISAPFHDGLIVVFTAAAVMSIIGAGASLPPRTEVPARRDHPGRAADPGPQS